MSQIDDLRREADLWRNIVSEQRLVCMLNRAADTIEALAKMCNNAECNSCDPDVDANGWCPWCGYWPPSDGHAPDCPYVTNGVAALLGEVTE
jgi:hypothetical protein